jgi:uncharacterized protein (DUF2235 family)
MTEQTPVRMADTTRQLVVFCDGTNNHLTGGSRDTNVVKLCELLAAAQDGSQQVFYDPGVGNPGELPGATLVDAWNRFSERLAGLAFGRGVYENIAETYLFLMRHYRSGDELFIFGFSRGAFTARSVAGLVNQFGILPAHLESMVPTLIHVYFSDRRLAPQASRAITDQTTRLFMPPGSRNVEIQFVGVWDTVASVGMWPFSAQFTALPTVDGKRFRNVRQALALDEHRAQFRPRPYANANGHYSTINGHPATLEQRWFSGAHGDIGGGYAPDQCGIANRTFAWLVSEAVGCGMRLVRDGAPLAAEDAVLAALAHTGPQPRPVVHSELQSTCLWALTGMAVRDTTLARMDGGPPVALPPVEHASVAGNGLQFPQDTVWTRRRSSRWFWASLCLAVFVSFALGQTLSPSSGSTGLWQEVLDWPGKAWGWQLQNLRFAHWQLLWWRDTDVAAGLARFGAPRWAVVWDLLLIAAYAYLLAWLAVAGFARRAGLRRAGQPVSAWLNRLGWALPVAVFSDIAENIATWSVVTLVDNQLHLLAVLAAVLMSAAALLKFLGLAGALVVCCLPARR